MKPTYLYIKQHSVTKLKYFGKTTKKDPVKYLGSGIYCKKQSYKGWICKNSQENNLGGC